MKKSPTDLIRSSLLKLQSRFRTRAPVVLDQFNVYEARSQFSRLLVRVVDGEEIVIARGGWPIAKLVPYSGRDETLPGVLRADLVIRPHAKLRPR